MIRISELSKHGILTGSTAFGVASREADEDWILYAYHAARCGINIAHCTHSYGRDREFATYREGRINVVLAMTGSFLEAWLAAHRHCQIERPKSRARRVDVFRHYMEGPKLP